MSEVGSRNPNKRQSNLEGDLASVETLVYSQDSHAVKKGMAKSRLASCR